MYEEYWLSYKYESKKLLKTECLLKAMEPIHVLGYTTQELNEQKF